MLDRVLKSSCPHDPATWHTAPTATGELLTSEDYLNMNSRLDLAHTSP